MERTDESSAELCERIFKGLALAFGRLGDLAVFRKLDGAAHVCPDCAGLG